MDSSQSSFEVARLLSERRLRLVLAESCSGGRCASLLTQVPGISQWFCGSSVTYRVKTKEQWLGIAPHQIEEFSAESLQVSKQMAVQVLARTPEADLSCAITGHLGPGVNSEVDGLVFLAVAIRNGKELDSVCVVRKSQQQLKSTERIERQLEAAELMLEELIAFLLTNSSLLKP